MLQLMSKRLQVLIGEDELAEIQTIARHQHMTVAEWVRQALRAARKEVPGRSIQDKLSLIQASAVHEFPVGPVDQVLSEMESGYLNDSTT